MPAKSHCSDLSRKISDAPATASSGKAAIGCILSHNSRGCAQVNKIVVQDESNQEGRCQVGHLCPLRPSLKVDIGGILLCVGRAGEHDVRP